jgi:hypothetical protein
MIRFKTRERIRGLATSLMFAGVLGVNALAQYSGGAAGSGSSTGSTATNQHLNFDHPESWALKYFASATLLSGLTPAESSLEAQHPGSVTVGFEVGWLPTLDAGQRRVGFGGTALEDLNKAPVFMRPIVRVGLPWRFTAIAAGPPPFEMFGVRPHVLAFGLERPIVEQQRWTLGWRSYGQVGAVKGAFTCPRGLAASPPGSPDNPQKCVAESADVATLRYAGAELQFAYRSPRMPKLVPHVASGVNFIYGAFQIHAPLQNGLDRTRLWTRGATFSESGGVSYLINKRVAFTVDAFYTPLWVR